MYDGVEDAKILCATLRRLCHAIIRISRPSTGSERLRAGHAGAAMSDDDSDEYEEAHVFDYTPPKQGTGHGVQAPAAYKPLAARALPL